MIGLLIKTFKDFLENLYIINNVCNHLKVQNLQRLQSKLLRSSGFNQIRIHHMVLYLEIIGIMKRLDQGHLHPKLEGPRLTCPGREPNPGLRGGRRAL
jgi:hypothetical protein